MSLVRLHFSVRRRVVTVGIVVLLILLLLWGLYVNGFLMTRDLQATVLVDGRPVPHARLFRDIQGNLFLPLDFPSVPPERFVFSDFHFPREAWVYYVVAEKTKVMVGNRGNYTEIGNLLFIHHQDQVGMVLGTAKSECEPNVIVDNGSVAFSTQDHKRITIQK